MESVKPLEKMTKKELLEEVKILQGKIYYIGVQANYCRTYKDCAEFTNDLKIRPTTA